MPNTMITDWLNKHGNSAIEQDVEKQAESDYLTAKEFDEMFDSGGQDMTANLKPIGSDFNKHVADKCVCYANLRTRIAELEEELEKAKQAYVQAATQSHITITEERHAAYTAGFKAAQDTEADLYEEGRKQGRFEANAEALKKHNAFYAQAVAEAYQKGHAAATEAHQEATNDAYGDGYEDGLQKGRKEAEHAVKEAQKEAQSKYHTGYAKGYKEGQDDGCNSCYAVADSDIATVEALHDLLLDKHGYSLGFSTLEKARALALKMHKARRNAK